jgi:S-adenosylmethionine synthetase
MNKTAEFVSPKHPDKLCDRISDTILDYCLTQDPNSRVAVEVQGGHGFININGEITTNIKEELPINDLVEQVVGKGYRIQVKLIQQSPEISRGVDTGGAGDQGIMVGYACDENDEYMPEEYRLARDLCRYIYNVYQYDGKTQVTLDSKKNIIAIVCSFQNAKREQLEQLITEWLDYKVDGIEIYCNPAGDWEQGGFDADAGLTGRKLVVDNYGPRVPIGGGAYSGKDPSKVDRSAAYMARHIAVKELKDKQLKECWVYLSYAIGRKEPLQATVKVRTQTNTFGSYDLPDEYSVQPNDIIKELDLKKPIYYETSQWGAYGNGFNWDKE